jgi:hypothetical protein
MADRTRAPAHVVCIFLLTACASLSGCYPSVGKYWRATAPDAAYLNGTCRGSFGPSSITYYPYHGIFVSLWLGNVASPALALHIPPGTVVVVNDKTMHIRGQSRTGAVEATLTLIATPGGLRNMGPDKIYGTRAETYTAPDSFGPLQGGDDHGLLLWYEYGANGPIPADVTSGTLILPSFTINGQRYQPQSVTFTQETFIGVAPINC